MSITIQVENQGDRLDRWLSSQRRDVSRSRWQKLIEDGNVLVNDQIVKDKNLKLKKGDRLHFTIPEAKPLELTPEAIPIDILYEDEHMIIINKPADFVVHPAPGHEHGTLVHALLFHCPDLPGIGDVLRPGIVHRIDKDTTGALVVAKNDYAHQHLQAQLKAKTARREYLGVIYGAPSQTTGTIDLPIGRHPVDRKKMAVVSIEKGGRHAVTHWQVLESLGNYTLMLFKLETGRTHQIRVHTTNTGHPLVGDPLYSAGHSIGVNLPGQALHAWKLTLEHPVTGQIIEAIAPLPEHFNKLLKVLRAKTSK